MKVTLLTTLSGLVETSRIKEEIENAGHEFFFVDWRDFHYTVLNKEVQIPELQTLLSSDVVIVRGIFNSIKSIISVVSYLRANGVKVFDNNLSENPYSIDKVTDILKLALHNVPTPDTYYERSFEEYKKICGSQKYPVVIKATRMGKGANVFKIDSEAELIEFIKIQEENEKSAKSFLLQEFIPYKYDLRVLVIGEAMFGMRRIPQGGEFRANFSLGGSVEVFPLTDDIKTLAKDAINAVGLYVAGVDVLIEEGGKMVILEVNHTPGFEGMEKATKANIGKVYVDFILNSAK